MENQRVSCELKSHTIVLHFKHGDAHRGAPGNSTGFELLLRSLRLPFICFWAVLESDSDLQVEVLGRHTSVARIC